MTEQVFSGDPDQQGDEGAVRPSGYIAFFLGIVSIAALLGDAWYLVPVMAILIALFALRPAPGGVAPYGRNWAVAGLMLSILFASWGATVQMIRHQALGEDATRFGRAWLDLMVEGQHQYAFELTLEPESRQLPGIDLQEFYRLSNSAEDSVYAEFLIDDVTLTLDQGKDKESFDWKLIKGPSVSRTYKKDIVKIVVQDANGVIEKPLRLSFRRSVDKETGIAEWVLTDASWEEDFNDPI